MAVSSWEALDDVSASTSSDNFSKHSTIGLYIYLNLIKPLWFSTHWVSYIYVSFVHLVWGQYFWMFCFKIGVLLAESLIKFPTAFTVPMQFLTLWIEQQWPIAKFNEWELQCTYKSIWIFFYFFFIFLNLLLPICYNIFYNIRLCFRINFNEIFGQEDTFLW